MQTVPFAPDQASSFAADVDGLYAFLWSLTVGLGVFLTVLILVFAVKYRRRQEDEIPRPVRASHRLELVWVVTPFVLAMGIFVWATSIYYRMYRPPAEAIDVYVVGKQWMWKFQHLDGQREINELHVPVGRKVKLTMTTEDVIHSFFVPAFRVKMDVVPGKYSTLWFEPTKPGRYHLFCAEYCGTSHSGMIGWINVMEAPEYQAWLSGGGAEGSLADAGQRLFQQLACNTCHKSDGSGRGPALEGVFGKQIQLADGQKVLADEAYLRESITEPRAKTVAGYQQIMPTFKGQVSEEQLLELIAYIRSISSGPAAGGSGAGGSGIPESQGSAPAAGSSTRQGTR